MKATSYIVSIGLLIHIFTYGSVPPPTPPAYAKLQPMSAPELKPKPGQLQTKYIDLLILFEEGGADSRIAKFISDEKDTGDYIIQTLFEGITLEIPTIISSVAIIALLKATEETKPGDAIFFDPVKNNFVGKKEYLENIVKTIKNNWNVTINKNQDFIILIPQKKMQGESLSTLGFQANNLSNFWNIVKSPYSYSSSETAININNFVSLFDPTSQIEKRIFLGGHGTSEAIGLKNFIVQLSRNEYRALLEALNNLNTQFLVVNSCYAGGTNLEKMHLNEENTNKEIFSVTILKYPLAIASTTDEGAPTRTSNLDKFFNNLNTYFKNQNPDDLKKAFNEIATRDSIPSIRFPGTNGFFRAIEINDQIKLLTITNLKAYEFGFKQKGKEIQPLEIGDIRTAILIYPAIINTPLKIDKLAWNPEVKFISMINGNALHIFNEIITSDMGLSITINKFIQPTTLLNKVFFIKKLVCKEGTFENITMQANKGPASKIIFKVAASRFWSEYIGEYREVTGLPMQATLGLGISDEIAQKAINNLVKDAMPSELSLYQATGGQQTKEMLEKSVNEALSQLPEYTSQKITMETIKAYKLGTPVEVNLDKQAELYPAYIPIPLKFIKVKFTPFNPQVFQIVSGIDGNALHILNEVITDASSDDMINAFTQKPGPIKTFLIRKLIAHDGIFENVILETSKPNSNIIFKVISWPIYPNFNGKYVQTQGLPHAWGDIQHGFVKPKDKIDAGLIVQILKEALPTPQALAKATDSQQTLGTLQKEITEVLATMK